MRTCDVLRSCHRSIRLLRENSVPSAFTFCSAKPIAAALNLCLVQVWAHELNPECQRKDSAPSIKLVRVGLAEKEQKPAEGKGISRAVIPGNSISQNKECGLEGAFAMCSRYNDEAGPATAGGAKSKGCWGQEDGTRLTGPAGPRSVFSFYLNDLQRRRGRGQGNCAQDPPSGKAGSEEVEV